MGDGREVAISDCQGWGDLGINDYDVGPMQAPAYLIIRGTYLFGGMSLHF
jgi:hypothetical protein